MDKTVLIIDDDTDDTEIFCEALKEVRGDIKCMVASGGQRAIDLIEISPVKDFAAIFLDVNMPVMTGWDVLTKLKTMSEVTNVPVFMYSTTSNQKEVILAQNMGASSFFVKPFNYELLVDGLKIIIAHLESGSLNEIGPLVEIHP